MPKILLIDDEVDFASLTAKRIRSQGYEVNCYFQGKGAIEEIQRMKPDLILLDIKLPHVSGFEIFSLMKREETLSTIPVIFLSALYHEERQCLEMGAKGFIQKPYDSAQLLSKIAQLLSH